MTNQQPQSIEAKVPSSHAKIRRMRWGLLIALLVTPLAVWHGDLTDRFLAKHWGVVVPGRIYRSGQSKRWLLRDLLTRHHIQTIVDLQGVDPTSPDQAVEIELGKQLGIEQYRFGMKGDGTTHDIGNYAGAIATLDRCERAGKPVLVHCAAGTHRTGGVVACYRVLVQHLTPETALEEMEMYGWEPQKHRILVDFMNAHIAELAAKLVQQGVIDQVPDPLPRFRLPGDLAVAADEPDSGRR